MSATRRQVEDIYRLSPLQEGMFFHSRSAPEAGLYVEQATCRLIGNLDAGALKRAWQRLVERHAVLRTGLFWEDLDHPVQVVYREVELPLAEEDWRALTGREARRRLDGFLDADRRRGFDLTGAPLMRLRLVRLADDAWRFVWTYHHLLIDGWSLFLLLGELLTLYGGLVRGEEVRLPRPRPFVDYLAWLDEQDPAAAAAWWRRTLAGFKAPTPLAMEAPAFGGGEGWGELGAVLPAPKAAALEALARRARVSLATLFQGAWALLLSRYSGEADVVFGTVVSGRPPHLRGIESMVGLLINTVPLRAAVESGAPLLTWLAELRERQAELRNYEWSPLPDVRRWSEVGAGVPLFESLLAFENYPRDPRLGLAGGGLEIRDLESRERTSFPLSLGVLPGEEVRLALGYERGRFAPSAMARLLAHVVNLLAGMAEDAGRSLGELPMTSAAERHQLLAEWNDTAAPPPGAAALGGVHGLIEAWAERAPHAVALVAGGRIASFRHLDRRANKLAHRLRELGVGAEDLVGLATGRVLELGVGLLGVLKAGAAFLPLDLDQPRERLALLFGDARVPVLLTLTDPAREVFCGLGGPAAPALLRLDAEPLDRHSPRPPEVATDLEQTAYAIYTSGSTGRPKGTLVSHRALVNLVVLLGRYYDLEPADRVLQFASLSFDVAVDELFATWAAGAAVVLRSAEAAASFAGFRDFVDRHRLSVIQPSTAFWHQWVDDLAASRTAPPACLRLLVTGGEAIRAGPWVRWHELAGRTVRSLAGYGPTEATVVVSYFEAWEDAAAPRFAPRGGAVPIGRPLANVRLRVLGPRLELVAIGLAGELSIAGSGLARGYLRRPGATAEKFVPDLRGPARGERLYRTGDLARYLADGNLEFLGRIDHQLKIRGFRVEPGEIEAALADHRAVREAAVVALEDAAGVRRLHAFLGAAPGRAVPPVGELRDFLGRRLPDYMMPHAFHVLASLPKSSTGKLDRAALAARAAAAPAPAVGFAAPVGEVESALAEIWAAVLGRPMVGRGDHFFELGGDSIATLQVVSRAAAAGIRLSPRQLFEHPTVAALAGVAGAAEAAEPEPEAGPAPLLPIQRWFFEQDLAEPHHWNMTLPLEVIRETPPPRLEAALARLADHHPALRSRFERGDGGWRQQVVARGAPPRVVVGEVDLEALAAGRRSEALEAAATVLQAALDLGAGPLLRAALFRRGEVRAPLLLIVVHHLVADAVSLRVLLEDLETLCVPGSQSSLPPSTSPRRWAEVLGEHTRSAELRCELAYWRGAAEGGAATALPVDLPGGANLEGSVALVRSELDAGATGVLLDEVHRAYRTRTDEVLVAALAEAVAGWTGERRLWLDLEGHGRQPIADVDLSRTVGWLTAVYPVLLEPAAGGPGEALVSVKEQLRRIPGGGLGYGVLRYLAEDEAAVRALRRASPPEVVFNYLGRLDASFAAGGRFAFADVPVGAVRSPAARRSHLLEVNAFVLGGRLRVEWAYSAAVHRRATIERLARSFLGALRRLCDHCLSPGAGRPTPSDFPAAELTQEELDLLARRLPAEAVEDVYRLSPLQEGMLFDSLYRPGSGVYVVQLACTLRGSLDAEALEGAWRLLLARHPILRTSFHWRGLAKPHQAVHREVALPWTAEDWRGLGPEHRAERLRAWLDDDRRRGYEPDRAPLLRLALARLDAGAHGFLWSHHHLLLDGWSSSLLLGELFDLYRALSRGRPPELAPAPPYRDYVEHLRARDPAAAESFWRRTLAGFTEPTRWTPETPAPEGRPPEPGRIETALPPGASAGLLALARRARLTPSAFVHGAWAVLLGRYSGAASVVFGTVVSGRPAGLAGVESMVGLFINTLPLRARIRPGAELLPWLEELRGHQIEVEEHGASSLVEIAAWSELPRGTALFDSHVNFENFPFGALDGALAGDLRAEDVVAREHTSEPVTLVALPGEELVLRLAWDRARLEPTAARRLLRHLERLLSEMIAEPGRRLGELPVLAAAERHQLLHEWNVDASAAPRWSAAGLHELFSEQVERTPDAVALVFAELRWSYRELGARAGRLARRLRELGVGPEAAVAVVLGRTPEAVVAVLGTLAAGGAYVPLDPNQPPRRLAAVVKDCRARALVTDPARVSAFPGGGLPPIVALGPTPPPLWGEDPAPVFRSANLAYVIYTSGSTGRPKGVMVEHRHVASYLEAVAARLDLGVAPSFAMVQHLSFDSPVTALYPTLLSGGCLHVIGDDRVGDAAYLARYLDDRPVDGLKITPTHLAALEKAAGRRLAPRRRLVVGGEASRRDWAEALAAEAAPAAVFNHYGPTEATVGVTTWRVDPGRRTGPGPLPIGRPLANARVYVVDRFLRPAPAGAAGELVLAGPCLARGYAGRPATTAAAFVPDPLAGERGERLYRTGDLARRLAGGVLELLGRIDQQVKVRGYRVELGEIEAALAAHPAVGEAAVAVPAGAGGLVAFVAPPAAIRDGELGAYLAERLPAHMLPSAWVGLEALPRTPGGKVDRRALRGPELGAIGEGGGPAAAPPSGPVEQQVAEIWAEVLGAPRAGRDDDFFELGGHSLSAMRVTSRLYEAFGVELSLERLFANSTLAGLAAVVEKALRRGSELPPLPSLEPGPRGAGAVPLSFAQERLWFLEQLDPGGPAYVVPAALRLEGPLRPDALAGALVEISRRHEVLRTTFAAAGGRPRQVIGAARARAVPVADLAGLGQARRQAEARRLAAAEARRGFDLERGPLLRASLVRLGPEEHHFLIAAHHVVSDEVSRAVFLRELAALYEAALAGRPSPFGELPVQYADYALWQRRWLTGEVLQKQLETWRRRLAGAPAAVDLPADRPRPPRPSGRGGRRPISVPATVAGDLRRTGRRRNATLFMALLAAFVALLRRSGAGDDVVVGTPVANRRLPALEGLIGFFVNTLALRPGPAAGDPAFVELVDRARECALEAYAHQDLPFEKLVDELRPARELRHAPVFQVMLALHNVPMPAPRLAGLGLEPLEADSGAARFELVAELTEEAEGGLGGALEYSRDLFDPTTAERLARHWLTLLGGVARESGRRLSELPLLAPEERHQLVAEWRGAARPASCRPALHLRFAAWAERTPEAVALACEGVLVSYGELARRSRRLAAGLRRRGAGPEARVGICLERSPDMVAAVLGVLGAGAAYVPLDPDHPAERLDFVARDSGIEVLVTGSDGARRPAGGRFHEVSVAGAEAGAGGPWPAAVDPENLAYIIYTSGSTGRPKGVGVTHANAARLFAATEAAFGFASRDVRTLFHSCAFDFSVWEMWGALAYGGRLVVVPYRVSRSPEDFWELLIDERVTVLDQTPSAFRRLTPLLRERRSRPALSTVVFGGEALDPAWLAPWFDDPALAGSPPRFVNMYGITETTVHVTSRPLARRDRRSLIGAPLADLTLHLLDGRLAPVPALVPGEIHVGGPGLARGYLGRPGLTAERFVPDPWAAAGTRLYRSGDLARRRPDGDVEFLGRTDHQVKVRGYRIELGEIESTLAGHPSVRRAAAAAVGEGDDKRLAVWVVAPASAEAELRELAKARLPDYMVPASWTFTRALPVTATGKVDRRALPAPGPGAGRRYLAPRTALERRIGEVWCEVLGRERVGVHDDFFDLGGHSLLVTRVAARLRESTGATVPVRLLFEHPTLAGLAGALEASNGLKAAAPPLVRRRRDGGPLPLSPAQRRLWFLARLDPSTSAYNMPFGVRWTGRLESAALDAAFEALQRRHEPLRASFPETGREPVQSVAPAPRARLHTVDLVALPAPARRAEAERLAAEEARRPFDLARGPLLRSVVLRLGAREHHLLATLHHIISDGVSMEIFVRELAQLYRAALAGRPAELPELPVRYTDYAAWQHEMLRGEALETQLAYWRERLSPSPPVLELPADGARPAAQSYRGASLSLELGGELSAALRELGRSRDATLFMTLLAAFKVLLGRLSGQDDVVVGTPIANRGRVEIEGLIGFFTNTLALRTDLAGDPTFAELLARVREHALGAYSHQDLPFERLVEELAPERDLAHTPLFQVFFNLVEGAPPSPELPGARIELLDRGAPESKFDLTLYAAAAGGGTSFHLVYNAELFSAARMAETLEQLRGLLRQMAERPDERISRYSLVTPTARRWLPDPDEELAAAWDGPVTAPFARRARAVPDRLAVTDPRVSWTYGELAARVRRLARELSARGLGAGEPVAIFGHRSAGLVWALAGVLEAGGRFVVLDPAWPPRRVLEVLGAVRPRAFVRLAATGPLPEEIEDYLRDPDLPCHVLSRRSPAPPEPAPEPAPLASGDRPAADDPAYVAFTSGSTGRPKGILGDHRPLAHFVRWQAKEYGLGAGDRFSLLSGLAHDPLLRDVFTPLGLGAAVAVPDPGDLAPHRLARWMADRRVTVAHLTPSTARLIDPEARLPALAWAFFGGEALRRRDVERLRRLAPRARAVNFYGTTETPQAVSAYAVPESGPATALRPLPLVPLGPGIEGVRMLIVNPAGEPAGVGELGEIRVRSPYLARGYLDDDALTRERFLGGPATRTYRTGDLGRYRPDGLIDWAGRRDDQVDVRGFRVELGEIDAALGEHRAVRAAAAVLAGERLVAFVEPEGEVPASAELRTFLAARLPGYMVPSTVTGLEALPRTAAGKVDRAALARRAAQARPAAALDDVTPRDLLEDQVATVWADVLGLERVGAGDDFFELGGHSLLATQVVSRLSASLGVEIPLRKLFEHPTVAALARQAAAARRAPAPPLARHCRDGEAPLSFAQQRLWFLDRLVPGNAFYNLTAAGRFSGELDVAALAAGLGEVVRRHETLRTTFEAVAGVPRLRVAAPAPFRLPVADLTALPEARRRTESERLARVLARRPFDLEAGPLLSVTLLREARAEHVLLVVMHHIVSDGWSMGVFAREAVTLYRAARGGEASPLAELAVQYADFARWQRGWLTGEVLETQLAYWRRKLAGELPVLELVADRPRPARPSYGGARCRFWLPEGPTGELRARGRPRGATLFMTLLAAFYALLYRYSGHTDLVVGTGVANRTRPEVEDLIGFFVNTLALRIDLSPARGLAFEALVERVREAALSAYGHQDLPFEKLVEELRPERDLSRAPLFQVAFALQNFAPFRLAAPGLVVTPLDVDTAAARLDLVFNLSEAGGALGGRVEYRTELFDATTVRRLAAHFESLLRDAAVRPSSSLHDLALLSAPERQQIVHEWSAGADDYDAGASGRRLVHQFVAAQAGRTPDRVAFVLERAFMSYRELGLRARRLARRLAAAGVGPEARVGVMMERSFDMVTALLAVVEAGGAYVPLDPALPRERLAFMMNDAAVAAVVADEGVSGLAGSSGAPVVCPGAEPPPAVRRHAAATVRTRPDHPVYVIYTSGSTGRPKGVVVSHRALANRLLFARDRDMGTDARVLLKTTLSFDVAVFEVFAPLVCGAAAVMVPSGAEHDLARLAGLIADQRVTHGSFPPSSLAALLDQEALPAAATLRHVTTGGEPVPPELPGLYAGRMGRHLINRYGPTETTISVTSGRCRPGVRVPAIGRPIAGARIFLADRALAPVPAGAHGEILVGGTCLARGYLDRPGLTASAFVPDPFGPDRGGRLYRTGDLARYRTDGALEFVARVDQQVKVRGFRVELGEIEAVLGRYPGVREAAVLARGDSAGDRRLVACVVLRDGAVPAELGPFLKERLPSYMVPAAFDVLAALPLSPTGKVDRAALARRALPPVSGAEPRQGRPGPRDALELGLVRIWEELLGVAPIGVDDDFFELGGHSLLAVRLQSRIRERFGRHLALAALFEGSTVARLAAALSRSSGPGPASPLVEITRGGDRPPFFCVHPAGGGVVCYVELARLLGGEQPFFGLQSPALEGGELMNGVEEMAARYLEEVVRAQPAGPYSLGGWSFGGLVAFEMARRLTERGDEVGLLALLDAPLPEGAGPAAEKEDDERELLRQALREHFPAAYAELGGLDDRGEIARAVERARKAGLLPADFDLDRARKLLRVYTANLRAGRSYRPRPYSGRITFFRAAGNGAPAAGWGRLAARGVEIETVPGDHRTMVSDPAVRVLAESLRRALARGR